MLVKVLVIGAYAVLTLAVGWLGLKKARTFTDFFLGGRTVGPLMSAFTYAAAYFSAVLFIGFAGKVGWGFGLSGLWIALANALVGVLGVWALLGEPHPEDVGRAPGDDHARVPGKALRQPVPEAHRLAGRLPLPRPLLGRRLHRPVLPVQGQFRPRLRARPCSSWDLFTAFYLVLGGYKSMTMIDVVFGLIMCLGSAVLIASTVGKAGGLGKPDIGPRGRSIRGSRPPSDRAGPGRSSPSSS
ncbi:MAG: hypothetical protein MZV64_63540 [Ignavibacteriales bacterium]|nr:hypothetical protein [Ignavibacteriales bacterium]